MEEFTISFLYHNSLQKACVLRTVRAKGIEYNIRPMAPFIVRKFGHQITIFWEDRSYHIQNRISTAHKELFNALVKAIHNYECEGMEKKIKIMTKRRDRSLSLKGEKASRLSPTHYK